MFTQEPRLQLEKFAINGARRLLQHNRPQSGHRELVSTCSSSAKPNELSRRVFRPLGCKNVKIEHRFIA
jgi:hypothetical protein